MITSQLSYRLAAPNDVDTLLELMHCRQQDDPWSVPFREEAVRQTVGELLANPSAGSAFLICLDQRSIGYLLLSFDFSMEYGGKNVWIDELFVLREFRGQGVGSNALEFAILTARECRATVMHLEVNRGNAAIDLYRRCGFEDHDRYLLSKWLVDK